MANAEYLKSVVLKYLTISEDDRPARRQLFEVIASALHFTPGELASGRNHHPAGPLIPGTRLVKGTGRAVGWLLGGQ